MAHSNFVIVSTQRSGSTLIRTSLDSHPQVSCYGEIFLPGYKREQSFAIHLKQRNIAWITSHLARRRLVNEFLDELYADNRTMAVGFKFMHNQASVLPYRFPMVMEYVAQHGVRVVHVVRRNLLKLCVSRFFARATGTYSTRTQVVSERGLRIDVQDLLRQIRKAERARARWRQRLSDLPSLEIAYEDFVAEKTQVSRQMLEFIGVDRTVELVSPLKKVLTRSIRDLVVNYQEVESGLKNAGYAALLDEPH